MTTGHGAGTPPEHRMHPDRPVVRAEVLTQGNLAPYHGLSAGPPEPHIVRTDLTGGTPSGTPRSLWHVAHLTDVQLIDAQSPSRLEAVHELGIRPETTLMLPMQRPQELLAAHATELLVRRLNEHPGSAVTGAPLQAVVTTGDNVDNMQQNEVQAFLRLFSGGTVDLDSGGPAYQGYQDGSVDWAWAPEDPDNRWGRAHGFPVVPGLLSRALQPLEASGLEIPWLTCFGNHDGLIQGRVPATPELVDITLGHRKVTAVRAEDVADFTGDPMPAFRELRREVDPDPRRRPVSRAEYVAAHWDRGLPDGHGFTDQNLADGTAYYAYQGFEGIRLLVLDSTNPAGVFEGSLDREQFAWLGEQLRAATAADELVVVASHHPRSSMTNDLLAPGADQETEARVLGEEVGELLLAHPHVIAWFSGHIHRNRITAHTGPGGGGYWEISTSSVMDWPTQGRLVELLDHGDGLLSLRLTILDHEGPLRPSSVETVEDLAGWHRALAANDPHGVGGFEAHGSAVDRNVELLLRDPRGRA
ncbi:TIGR03767 family metallophosphoesterase [Ornithinicoccus hortensis]|uniref:Metallophosphoesterase (TIGR03767 family) n=1 Tax=Ornithinicoccus hortensis TaxID=82346 RepID=A0A542YUY1_9MICO|nr:TIGR03767 family metallophosphoesterase [Ornithinicoccus hortensis]TQL51885.1 metallophosphoesterase (TIGR03767 family) [Ornithinicoccus hortensis]